MSFRTGDFKESIRNSRSYLAKVAQSVNPVDEEALTGAFMQANKIRIAGYNDMLKFVNAAKASGVGDMSLRRLLKASNVSKDYINALVRGKEAPKWKIGKTFMKGNIKRAQELIGRETAQELKDRRKFVQRESRALQ